MSELLELHRASAGSGKTYTLTKKFLWYFLTIRENPEAMSRRRLRTPAELSDSLSHILAVTFTNKATNEMKQRIVEKLNALAYLPKEYLAGDIEKEPDYMRDFIIALNDLPEEISKEDYKRLVYDGELEVTPSKISDLARKGMYILLENYSDFHVSTIDSFFQLVLRTFAYETDLNDSYAVEIDSKYLAKVSIDATLQDIEDRKASAQVKYWIDLLMNTYRTAGSNKWNLFQKSDTQNSNYSDFKESLAKLENEEFKKIRDVLEDYFERTPNLIDVYEGLNGIVDGYLKERWQEMARNAKALMALLSTTVIDEKDKESATKRKFRDHARKSLEYRFNKLPSKTYAALSEASFKLTTDKNRPTEYAKRKAGDPSFYNAAEEAYLKMAEAYEAWIAAFNEEKVKLWTIYKKKFPYLGLLQAVMRKRREYLEENNSVELGETNILLRRIIGQEDAPFIYERLGSRLNHFMIDEFQDTSGLQWENFRPLLIESLSRGNENLLIGDAKQSIYRFRNADSSLISQKVEQEFPVSLHGNIPKENTNYRSAEVVVKFNNGFFRYVTDRLGSEVFDVGGTMDFRNLYGNVEQNLPSFSISNPPKGYVEVNLVDGDNAEDRKEYPLQQIPIIVNDLRQRGYLLKDIAVLVSRNDEGTAVIGALTEYNSGLEDISERIDFISEESLTLVSSESVNVILNTLSAISKGTNPEVRTGEGARKKGVADWRQVESNFRVFALSHPELTAPEQLSEFLKSGADSNAIANMLAEMQAVTLPALVEGITATFITKKMRQRDSAYIAAFQDIVLSYCDSHPSDISSFLSWWEHRGKSASISSPEDMDALTVMTIHKSKGLEFPCVIIPYAQTDFNKEGKNKEWRWVEPLLKAPEGLEMPPFVPVDVTKDMEGTGHESVFRQYLDQRTMDNLNKIYVAFTRAANELYIFSSSAKDGALDVSSMLKEYLDGDGERITVGDKYEKCPVKRKEKPFEMLILDDYISNVSTDLLKYREKDVPAIVDAEEFEEDEDPRSEGNLLHLLMESTVTEKDIKSSVSRQVHKGIIGKAQGAELETLIRGWLENPEVKGWFDGKCKIITERPLIGGDGDKERRPDRLVISPDGTVTVVDYKFGGYVNLKKYSGQVRNYMWKLIKTRRFKKVEGYLWYVREGKIVPVDLYPDKESKP